MRALVALLLPWLLAASPALAATVFFRKHTRGNIFALGASETELEGTAQAPRLGALALAAARLLWSDHQSVRSARADDGADPRTLVGALARVVWTGVNFGDARAELSVLGTRCVSVARWSPTRVECLVALPSVVDAAPAEDDCVIRTARGEMRGVARNRYDEMRASGLASPIVESLAIDAARVAPLALAADGDSALFWANALDGTIYRSSLTDTAIAVVQRDAWETKGLAVLRWAGQTELLYSLEGKGLIQRTRVGGGSSEPPQAVVSGLRSPRGLAVDPRQQYLYWTEKTGRIYRVALAKLAPLQDGAREPSAALPAPQLLVTLSSLTRLDGLAVDDAYLYWTETNTNVVARAPLDTFAREVLVGGSADSALSWPRGIALKSSDGASNAANDDYYYVEYTGRVSKGKARVLVNELRSSSMKYLDQLILQRETATQFYALE